MPFDAAALSDVENALAGCYQYHTNFDNFIIRSGIDRADLITPRENAEARVDKERFDRAPKRYVAQELINILNSKGKNGDILISNIITSLTKGTFNDATEKSLNSIENLKKRIEQDKKESAKKNEKRRSKQNPEKKFAKKVPKMPLGKKRHSAEKN